MCCDSVECTRILTVVVVITVGYACQHLKATSDATMSSGLWPHAPSRILQTNHTILYSLKHFASKELGSGMVGLPWRQSCRFFVAWPELKNPEATEVAAR